MYKESIFFRPSINQENNRIETGKEKYQLEPKDFWLSASPGTTVLAQNLRFPFFPYTTIETSILQSPLLNFSPLLSQIGPLQDSVTHRWI